MPVSCWVSGMPHVSSTTEGHGADGVHRSSVLQGHFRIRVLASRFCSLPSPAEQQAAFHDQAVRWFGSAWAEGVCAVAGIAVVALRAAGGTQTLWAMKQLVLGISA